MSELLTGCLTVENTKDGVVIEPEFLEYMRGQGYVIHKVLETHTVDSHSRDGSHLVLKAKVHQWDRGHPSCDLADEKQQVDMWLCGCEDWQYNQSVDISEPDKTPDMCGSCKHVRRVSREERAKQDPNQDTLTADN